MSLEALFWFDSRFAVQWMLNENSNSETRYLKFCRKSKELRKVIDVLILIRKVNIPFGAWKWRVDVAKQARQSEQRHQMKSRDLKDKKIIFELNQKFRKNSSRKCLEFLIWNNYFWRLDGKYEIFAIFLIEFRNGKLILPLKNGKPQISGIQIVALFSMYAYEYKSNKAQKLA